MGRRGVAQALGAVGRLLIASGVVLLLFAGYQLWGTGLSEARAQGDLSDEFGRRLAAAGQLATRLPTDPATTVAAPGATGGTPAAPTAESLPPELVDLLFPATGAPMARLVIPRIGVDKVVVEGVETSDLRKGPGHFPDTPMPGQVGNAAIAGHRTTYGAPFGDLDVLRPGDEIRVTTVLGEAVYLVKGTRIVEPEQVEVIGDFGDNRLTLSACHPKFSAAQRIIVWAELATPPLPTIARPGDRVTVDLTAPTTAPAVDPAPTVPGAPATTTATAPPATTASATGDDGAEGASVTAEAVSDNELAGDASAWPGAVLWGALTVVAGLGAWSVARLVERRAGRRAPARRLAVYAAASPVVLAALFVCFTYVDRLLPAY